MDYTNRIQFYRKSLGLSQEELGEKMFVSRQTVSQWETGQTTPSLESLIKLREIFVVSIDSILGVEDTKEADGAVPASTENEVYTFKYSKDEMKKIIKSNTDNKPKRRILCLIILSVLSFAAMIDTGSDVFAILFGFSVGLLIIFTGVLISTKKTNKKTAEQCSQITYEYTLADGILTAKTIKNGAIYLEARRPIYEIEKLTDIGEYYTFVMSSYMYMIRKADLSADSRLLLYLKSNANLKILPSRSEKRLKILSVITFILSIASLFIALMISGAVAETTGNISDTTQYMWVLFLFIPIPVFSIIFGVWLKKRGMKYKKNIVIGIIMCVLLCLYGSFTFIFSGMHKAIDTVREEMNIELPEYSNYSMSANAKTKDSDTMKGLSICHITFSAENTEKFYNSLDENWLTDFPDELDEYIAVDNYKNHLCLLYNTETGEYNTVPKKHGDYDMILLLFSKSENELYIMRYRLLT